MADTIEESHNPVTAASLNERDADRLGDFGYEQELRRDWGLMHNFGISFSIIVGTQPIATELCLLMYHRAW